MNNRHWIILTTFRLIIMGLLLCPVLPVSAATDTHAAVLTILHEGVTLQRADTEAWLPLAAGSVAPFGSGDHLQTGETGRALLTFWDGSQTLILPRSTYHLAELVIANNTGVRLSAHLTGTAVHRLHTPSPALDYRLTLPGLTVMQPANWFATWGNADGSGTVTVAEGTAEISLGDQVLALAAGQGLTSDAATHTLIEYDAPWNEARLQGVINGCPGTVHTTNGVELRVRVGPGVGYVVQGAYDYEQPVQLMGVNESGGWYRVQFLSGFGWMQKLGVETACTDLPILADGTIETPLYIIDASEDEIDWFRMFFDFPVKNMWFYQWSPDPTAE